MKALAVGLVVAVLLCASSSFAAEPIPSIKPPADRKAAAPDAAPEKPAAPARDAIELMDGTRLTGAILYQDAQSIGFKSDAGEKFVLPWDSIASVRRADGVVIRQAPAPATAPATIAPAVTVEDLPPTAAPYQPPKGRKKRAAQAQELIGDYPKPPADLPLPPPPVATAQSIYDERSISPTLALVLEIVPGLGVGNFYARNYGWGVLELASYALLIAGIATVNDNAAEGWVFVSVACAARLGGIVVAPLAAHRYNDSLRRELKLTLPVGRDAAGARGLALGVEF